jgi:hypothetical protein
MIEGALDGKHLHQGRRGEHRNPEKRHLPGARRKLTDIFGDDDASLVRQQIGEQELLQCRTQADTHGQIGNHGERCGYHRHQADQGGK